MDFSWWPLLVLIVGTLSVLTLIVGLRMHAFFALMLSAMLCGILTHLNQPGVEWIDAIKVAMTEFGSTCGKVGFVIALASILGIALTNSGAADKIVTKLVALFGEKRAAWALVIAGFVLSIPVFFDTVFFLMIPIATSLAVRTGKNFLLYVLAIGCGGVITHGMVPPTPGPLVMAETIQLNVGTAIVAGSLAGIIPAIVGYWFSLYLNRTVSVTQPQAAALSSNETIANRPGLLLSLIPIVLPIGLIVTASLFQISEDQPSGALSLLNFLGEKNIAMLLGTIFAVGLWARSSGKSIRGLCDQMEEPIQLAASIILITGAGGAFGAMIKHSGIAEMITDYSAGGFSMNLLVVAWLLTCIIKFAQGSGTVSVITAAGIMTAIVGDGSDLPYHLAYIYLAIGFGSMVGSWMNDSGFWIVGKLSGFTEQQTLRTWTPLLAVIGIAGIIQVLILSQLLPLV